MLKFTEHPIVKAPTPAQQLRLLDTNPQGLVELHEMHERRIADAERDPVYNGFILPQQAEVEKRLSNHTEAWCFGGNRSGKSFNSSRMVMRALLENPGTTIICWAQNEEASIEMQQPYLWQMLPHDLKKKIASEVCNINYNEKTGFTAKKFVLPNGSKCLFRYYSQFISNQKMIEGYSLGLPGKKCGYLNIGTWLDEYYMDETLIKRLYRRCADFDAKILTSFTPLDGYTPLVNTVLSGATTLKVLGASLLNKDMPYVIQPKKPTSVAVFFHTERNPFTNFQRLKNDLADASEEEVMTVAYGYPVSSIKTLFPLFSEQVHVVDKRPNLSKSRHTLYQVVDPAGRRSYSALWASVDAEGNINILKEFPERETYGAWAEFGSPRWKNGPASEKHIYSVRDYAKEFRRIETEELGMDPYERIGDSRAFARENDDSSDLRDQFADIKEEDLKLYFTPADGRIEEIGLMAVEDWFHYNPNFDVNSENKPLCHIHKSCGNLIDSLINYGACGKEDEALKDFVDLMRYLRLCNNGDGPDHVVGSVDLVTTRQGDGGY